MKQVDEETRRQVAIDRLATLERDQAASSIDALGAENDIWEPSDVSDNEGKVHKRKSTGPKSRGRSSTLAQPDSSQTRGQRRPRKTVEMILMDEPLYLPHADTYHSVMAPPASKLPGIYPALNLCSVCSYQGPYNCVRCGTKYCSLQCMNIHKDTKCLKFAD
jgi:zinc finger HIT domain-containing protein 1